MIYYFLDFTNNNDVFFSEYMIVEPDDWLRKKSFGREITYDNVKIKLLETTGNFDEYLANIQGLLILREDIVCCIEDLQSNHFQKFNVEIELSTESDYFFIHLLDHVDAIIVEDSEVIQPIPDLPIYDEIRNLKLDTSKIKDRHIFSIKGIPNRVVISEALRNKIEAECPLKITNFTNCDGYHWKISPFT